MGTERTLKQLRRGAYRRADIPENSKFVPKDEANDYVNDAVAELYDLLVRTYKDYKVLKTNITLVSGTEEYTLPRDFFKVRQVFYLSGNIRYTLEPFMLEEITDYEVDRVIPLASNEYLRYRVVGSDLIFAPVPSSGGTVELWYIPEAKKMKTDGERLSFPAVNGWDTFIEVGAAIPMALKEEQDPSGLMAQKAELRARIEAGARTRDAGKPSRVIDVYSSRRLGVGRRRF